MVSFRGTKSLFSRDLTRGTFSPRINHTNRKEEYKWRGPRGCRLTIQWDTFTVGIFDLCFGLAADRSDKRMATAEVRPLREEWGDATRRTAMASEAGLIHQAITEVVM